MAVSLPSPVPAHSKAGTDHYLILGIKDDGDLWAIDQDGDLRSVYLTDVQTEWIFLPELEVWFNRQPTLEDLQEVEEEEEEAVVPAEIPDLT